MTSRLRLAGDPAPSAVPLLGTAVHYLRSGSQAISELEPETLAAHHRTFGPRPSCAGEGGRVLFRRLDAAALTGRGGGHFPVAAKWRRVQSARLARPGGSVVVANGAEGEPLSRKDSALLELRPHLVLDGLSCAAEALGANDAVVWLHEDAHIVRAAVTRALAERPAGAPPIRIAVGPAHYLTGESSAVVRGLSGGRPVPGLARMPAAEAGVDGRPTLVQNVESLARVALLARGSDPRSVLITLASGDQLVVVEYPEHTTLRAAVTTGLGAIAPQALLVGGYGGRWIEWDRAAGMSMRESELRGHGVSLGAGVIAPLRADECGLRRTAEIAGFLAESSARQCGPCQFGLPAVAAIMHELARGKARRRDSRRLERFLAEVDGRGACHHPDGAVALVRSALHTFADDVAEHLRGRCRHDGRA
jgi:NADH:ubiquinone oxidoreductase subunit F (NADH-binding)